jgi:AraC-like DNA-binding protein
MASDLDMEVLARRSGISSSRLAHLFQAQLGLSPLQYKNFARLQHFVRLSGEADANILRAALRAGFGSYPQFHRVYQQVCGAPPRAHLNWLMNNEALDAARTIGSSGG